MEAELNAFRQRLQTPWLTDTAAQQRLRITFEHCATLLQARGQGCAVVIACSAPEAGLAATLAALATQQATFIANPQWTAEQEAEAQRLIGADQLWLRDSCATDGDRNALARNTFTSNPHHIGITALHCAAPAATYAAPTTPTAAVTPAATTNPTASTKPTDSTNSAANRHTHQGCLMIPTGGTGGRLKFAIHDWCSLQSAIGGYASFWQAQQLNFVCALPVFHIGGLMLALRSFATAGRLCLLPWQTLQALALSETEQPTGATMQTNAAAQTQTAATAAATTTPATTTATGSSTTEASASIVATSASITTSAYGNLPDIFALAEGWHISLVPTQVQRLLTAHHATLWLQKMQAVLIGGGATAPALLHAAAEAGLPLCPAYGMTETAATIALQHPAQFLQGYRNWREHTHAVSAAVTEQTTVQQEKTQPQPPAEAEAPLGEVLPHLHASLEAGSSRIQLSGASLFYGYYPQLPQVQSVFATSDFGELLTTKDGRQQLRVLGRLDRVVVSGGKKIDPTLVERTIAKEAALLGLPLSGVLVVGVPDPQWGERLVAFLQTEQQQPLQQTPQPAAEAPASGTVQQLDLLRQAVRRAIGPTQSPKQWLLRNSLPLDERGKPDRAQIDRLCGTPER